MSEEDRVQLWFQELVQQNPDLVDVVSSLQHFFSERGFAGKDFEESIQSEVTLIEKQEPQAKLKSDPNEN